MVVRTRSAVGRLAFHQRHQSIKRASDRVDRSRGHLGVERGRLKLAVPEQNLDDADVGAIFEKMGGEAVPQCVRTDTLMDPGHFGCFLHRAMQLS